MKVTLYAVAIAAVFLVAPPANATLWTFDSILLDGLQETPPVATPAYGSATATLDDVTNEFILSGTFSDLVGTSNNAHMHGPAAIGVGPVGVLFGITFDFGVTSGNFSFNGIISAAHTATILDGNSYINIHSTFRPGGEIRGQLSDPTAVPEPAACVMLAMGTFGFALHRRRSR